MADVDSREKRQSATAHCQAYMLSPVFPDTNGIDAAERQAIAWCYNGIGAGIPTSGTNRYGLLLGVYRS